MSTVSGEKSGTNTHQSFELTAISHGPTPRVSYNLSATPRSARASTALAQIRRNEEEAETARMRTSHLLPPRVYTHSTPRQSTDMLVHWSDRSRTPSSLGNSGDVV